MTLIYAYRYYGNGRRLFVCSINAKSSLWRKRTGLTCILTYTPYAPKQWPEECLGFASIAVVVKSTPRPLSSDTPKIYTPKLLFRPLHCPETQAGMGGGFRAWGLGLRVKGG